MEFGVSIGSKRSEIKIKEWFLENCLLLSLSALLSPRKEGMHCEH